MTDIDTYLQPQTSRSSQKRVLVAVSDSALRLATVSVLSEAGYKVTHLDDGEIRVITDDPVRTSPRAILFVDEVAGSARLAVDALMSANLGGIVSRRRPQDVVTALNSVIAGFIAGPISILHAAAHAPSLDRRQLRILAMLGAGRSNPEMALQLKLSEATVKREVSMLLRVFGVRTRLELAMKTTAVGYAS